MKATPTEERRALLRTLLAGGAVLCGRSLTASGSTACPALPEETSGPFPADGSHRQNPGPQGQHEVPNILAAPGIVRQDIRASFNASSTVAAGVPLQFTDHEGRATFQTIFPACYSATTWCSPRAPPPSSPCKPWTSPATQRPVLPDAPLSEFGLEVSLLQPEEVLCRS
jgi:hypothetical protein